ncbi:PP2C family serine/threonine-protein phosphatase [Vibrio splendidus]
MLKVNYSSSDIGDRTENLDRLGHIQGDNWSFSYVLDGFEVVTPHYVDSLQESLQCIKNLSSITSKSDILIALYSAINQIHKGKGKASVAFVICIDGKISTLTAGDTRVYRVDSLDRTIDHSLAQKMINDGKSPKASLHQHPYRRYLLKKLYPGCSKEELTLNEYDNIESIMLCSDGIWSCFKKDEELYDHLPKGPESVLKIARSNRKKHRDNMTMLWLIPME